MRWVEDVNGMVHVPPKLHHLGIPFFAAALALQNEDVDIGSDNWAGVWFVQLLFVGEFVTRRVEVTPVFGAPFRPLSGDHRPHPRAPPLHEHINHICFRYHHLTDRGSVQPPQDAHLY